MDRTILASCTLVETNHYWRVAEVLNALCLHRPIAAILLLLLLLLRYGALAVLLGLPCPPSATAESTWDCFRDRRRDPKMTKMMVTVVAVVVFAVLSTMKMMCCCCSSYFRFCTCCPSQCPTCACLCNASPRAPDASGQDECSLWPETPHRTL